MMIRKIGLLALIAGLILAGVPRAQRSPAVAQGPEAWTIYILNMRTGPGATYDVITELPADTGLIIEAHNGGDMSWLLGHTEDGAYRGWVASGYLRYREGFTAARLPVSTEIVNPAAAPPPPAPDAPPGAAPPTEEAPPVDGALISKTLVYKTDHSEYYRIVYWSEGLKIHGYLGYPTREGRFPAIIFNRGGIWDGELTGAEIVPFVEVGYVAAASQYRGYAGSDGWKEFGAGDVGDTLNLIPLLDSLPNVDPSRIGMMGTSRGGMVAYMALKHDTLRRTYRIRAAVTVAGLADLFMWADERPDIIESVYMPTIGKHPEVAPNEYIARSATYWPELINAPLLLLHGTADVGVWEEQSRALHDALKDAGKTCELRIFPGDDHQLSGQLYGYPAAIDWFRRYLSGGDTFDNHWDDISPIMNWFFKTPH